MDKIVFTEYKYLSIEILNELINNNFFTFEEIKPLVIKNFSENEKLCKYIKKIEKMENKFEHIERTEFWKEKDILENILNNSKKFIKKYSYDIRIKEDEETNWDVYYEIVVRERRRFCVIKYTDPFSEDSLELYGSFTESEAKEKVDELSGKSNHLYFFTIAKFAE